MALITSPVFEAVVDDATETVRVVICHGVLQPPGAPPLTSNRAPDNNDTGLSCMFGVTKVPCTRAADGTVGCKCPPPRPCRGRYAQEKEVKLTLVKDATGETLAEATFDYTALPFWRKPSLEGRFSGRLPTKADEKSVVEECKLLAPLLGGQGKHGDQSLVTLAKLVRGIATGDVRRHCEMRERTITVLQTRVAELEAATGLVPHEGAVSGDALQALEAQLEAKDTELSVICKKLADREAHISAMKQLSEMRPVAIRAGSSSLASPSNATQVAVPTGSDDLPADPKGKASKRRQGQSPRGEDGGSCFVSEDCCSTVPEIHTVTTHGSSFVVTGTSNCCCPERHPVLGQRIMHVKGEGPECPPGAAGTCPPGAVGVAACCPAGTNAATCEQSTCDTGCASGRRFELSPTGLYCGLTPPADHDMQCQPSSSPAGRCGGRSKGVRACGVDGGSDVRGVRDSASELRDSLGQHLVLTCDPVTRLMQFQAQAQQAQHVAAHAPTQQQAQQHAQQQARYQLHAQRAAALQQRAGGSGPLTAALSAADMRPFGSYGGGPMMPPDAMRRGSVHQGHMAHQVLMAELGAGLTMAHGSHAHTHAAGGAQGQPGNGDDALDLQWLVADLDIIEGMSSMSEHEQRARAGRLLS